MMMTSTRSARTAWRKTALSLAALILLGAFPVFAQEPPCKSRAGDVKKPQYPELARRMKISGVVRLQLQLGLGGSVRVTKVLGGNPILATSAQDAVKNAHFEGAESCIITFEFKD
jgi:TonB family protein